jgi:predicted N-acetyltransferase YhbS
MPARHPPVTIRPMTRADVGPAADMIVAGGWGDRRPFFAFAVGHEACRPIVAELAGRVIATGVGTVNGRSGWVGTVFVEPERRGRGLGRAVTERVIDDLDAAGCRTLVLTASTEGRPLYERMAFETTAEYVIVEAVGGDPTEDAELRPPTPPRTGVRRFEPADLPAILALDRAASGEDRAHLVAALANPATTRCAVTDGEIRGFRLRPPWGGGALVAPEPDAAIALLEDRRAGVPAGHRVRAGLTARNASGIERLVRLGWTDTFRIPRMELGEPLAWEPAAIWGQFSFALG